MKRNATVALAKWLSAGGSRIGQLFIQRHGHVFSLRHVDDAGRDNLRVCSRPEDARALANYNEAGEFRPLKTTRDLARGWRLELDDIDALRVALDYLYPAMVGIWASWEREELESVSWRGTLNRQTGMYRVTQRITDEQSRAMIDSFCARCLKCRLWDGQHPSPGKDEMPLLCHEACNLLVAEARKIVKSESA
ncbi:MAG: DR2241 family protein [Chthoniobacteraceae bacterium]